MTNWALLKPCTIKTQAVTWDTALTPDSTAHTKSSWAEIVSSVPFNSYGIIVQMTRTGDDERFLFDIGIGGSGSEEVLMSNFGYTIPTWVNNYMSYYIHCPILVPSGVRLAGRSQCSAGSGGALYVKIYYLGTTLIGGLGFSKIISFGENTGTTNGTEVDPGGTVDTKGSWVEFTSSSPERIKAIAMMPMDDNAVSAAALWTMDIGIGGAGSEQVIIPDWLWCSTSASDKVSPFNTPFFPVDIPVGTRIAVRSKCDINDTTDRKFPIILYGVV